MASSLTSRHLSEVRPVIIPNLLASVVPLREACRTGGPRFDLSGAQRLRPAPQARAIASSEALPSIAVLGFNQRVDIRSDLVITAGPLDEYTKSDNVVKRASSPPASTARAFNGHLTRPPRAPSRAAAGLRDVVPLVARRLHCPRRT